ncbi:hypothetical protein GCM10010193_39910 [Kitasatospora atroaurantiaca]
MLALRVRRFACPDRSCPRRTFVEQIEGLTRRQRRSLFYDQQSYRWTVGRSGQVRQMKT